MNCSFCNQEMTTASSCLGGIDLTAPDVEVGSNYRCPDCKVMPGGTHHPGCDVERCSACGRQALSGCNCEDHDPMKARWTGLWPGKKECRALGLFCRDFHPDGQVVTPENPIDWDSDEHLRIRWHVPCKAGDLGAHEDLNRLAVYQQTVARG